MYKHVFIALTLAAGGLFLAAGQASADVVDDFHGPDDRVRTHTVSHHTHGTRVTRTAHSVSYSTLTTRTLSHRSSVPVTALLY
ncbi:hypothetical protein HII36_00200 [Nonomuraea sp. NN258]|uniref:hypothetical protein n=1 Tax=Nonomuraea antri TaxID=2730852 RepID=UPI00156871FD|nr:hypothetical protein [Nonomuraea antri]NRQ30264.1 hypothetical protein [Nonomuraea antri]